MFLVPLTRNANELSRSFDRLFDDNLFDRVFAPTRAESSATMAHGVLTLTLAKRGASQVKQLSVS